MVSGRPLLVVAMAAMLVLAGCSGGQGTETTSPTTAPTTDPGDDGTGVDDVETQRWMDGDGVDAESLVNAHYASLNGQSHRIDTYQNSTGMLSLERTATQRVGADGTTILEADSISSNGNFSTRAFVNDTWVITESKNATRTISSAYRPPDTDAEFNQSQSLVQYVALGNYSVNRTFEVDGETRIEYVATGPADTQAAQSITSFDGRFVVSTDGRIHSLTVNATQEAQYGEAVSHFEYTVSQVGDVDVSTPSWVAEVTAAATVVDLSYDYNGSVIEVAHDGGDTITEGSQIVVQPAQGQGLAFAELPRDFEPGDTIYLTASGGRELDVSFNQTAKPDTGIGGPIRFSMIEKNQATIVKTLLYPGGNETARTATVGLGHGLLVVDPVLQATA